MLVAEADLRFFQEVPYFEGIEVRERPRDRRLLNPDVTGKLAGEAIPEINGQVVLEGASGLGKSMFLAGWWSGRGAWWFICRPRDAPRG